MGCTPAPGPSAQFDARDGLSRNVDPGILFQVAAEPALTLEKFSQFVCMVVLGRALIRAERGSAPLRRRVPEGCATGWFNALEGAD
jgi:hypothetical protein